MFIMVMVYSMCQLFYVDFSRAHLLRITLIYLSCVTYQEVLWSFIAVLSFCVIINVGELIIITLLHRLSLWENYSSASLCVLCGSCYLLRLCVSFGLFYVLCLVHKLLGSIIMFHVPVLVCSCITDFGLPLYSIVFGYTMYDFYL